MTSPALRIVRGHPTAEELAAVVTVLAAAASRRPGPAAGAPAVLPRTGPPPGGAGWSARGAAMRRTGVPGRGGWRATALPR